LLRNQWPLCVGLRTLRDGYEFEGRKYKSLSAIAREITGTRWNGYRFFGLRETQRRNP
jgi:hypothetical protein